MIGRLIRRWRDWRETRRWWRWDEVIAWALLAATVEVIEGGGLESRVAPLFRPVLRC